MAEILIVEDEPTLRLLLTRVLSDAGHRVAEAENGSIGMQKALSDKPDLVILDLMLPDLSGEEVLRVLMAANPGIRVLVLSSTSEVARRVGVLDGGAADFMAKPFANGELLARVRARLREDVQVNAHSVPRYLMGRDFQLDLQRRELVINGERTELPPREFVLLTHLLQRRGQVCTRKELLSDVWGIGFDPGTNVVDVYVRRLRNRLRPDTIETVRNVGYRLLAS